VVTTGKAAPIRNYNTIKNHTLSWGRVSWAAEYEIQVSTTSNFAGTPVFSDTVDKFTLSIIVEDAVQLPNGLSEGIYYFRVRGRKADGTWSTVWSTVDSFVVDLPGI
jgi:hypothetical protein